MTKRKSMLKKTRQITDAEHQRILEEVKCSEFRSFLSLLFHNGGRPYELASLSAEDVNRTGNSGPLFACLPGGSPGEIQRLFTKFRRMARMEPGVTIHSYRLRILNGLEGTK